MHILYSVLLILHIACAAVVFGGAMGQTRSLRLNLSGSREALLAIARDAARKSRVTGIFSILTLLSGIVLIFVVGGFGSVRVTIHIALTLMLVVIAVGATIMGPQTTRLVGLVEATPFDLEAAQKAVKKLTMGQGIIHLLWLVILALMIVR